MKPMDERLVSEAVASKYWNEDSARAVLNAWRASGLGAAEFARRHGIRPGRLLRWSRQVCPDERADSGLSFVQVAVERPAAVPVAPRPALEVSVGRAVIRVEAGFDRTHLVEVLRALREASC